MKFLFLNLIFLLSTISTLSHAERYTGRIDFVNRVTLGTTISGKIKTVNVAPGDHVKKNQTLIVLDPTPFQAQSDKFKAELQYVKAELRKAKRDLVHAQELYDRAALSTVFLEDAKIRVEQTAALILKAKADLRLANYNLEQSKIIAPFDAWVINLNAIQQQSIVNNLQTQSLVTLATANKYAVYLNVPLSTAKSLRNKKAVKVLVDDMNFSGVITTLSLDGKITKDNHEPYYELTVEFESNTQRYVAGESATIEL